MAKATQTSARVAARGAGDALHWRRLVVAALVIVGCVVTTKLATLDDPNYWHRQSNLWRLTLCGITGLASFILTWWMTTVRSRAALAVLLWTAWAATIAVGALHWLGAALAVSGALAALAAVGTAWSYRHQVGPRIASVLPQLQAEAEPSVGDGETLHGTSAQAVRVDGEYRAQDGQLWHALTLQPTSFAFTTDDGDTVEVSPIAIGAPELTERLLEGAGLWSRRGAIALAPGERFTLRGVVSWDSAKSAPGNYRDAADDEPRRGQLVGPVEILGEDLAAARPRGSIGWAVFAACAALVCGLTGSLYQFTPPEPEVKTPGPLRATIAKKTVDTRKHTVSLDIDLAAGTGKGRLTVEVEKAKLGSDAHDIDVVVDERYDAAKRRLHVVTHGKGPRAGRAYTLELALRAKRFDGSHLVAKHRLTRVKTGAVLREPTLKNEFGRVKCSDDDCVVTTSGDAVKATAQAPLVLKVAGQRVEADGRAHEIRLDVVSLLAHKPVERWDQKEALAVPVEATYPSGAKLTESFDPGSRFVAQTLTDLFRPVLTNGKGVALKAHDDAEPEEPRVLLHFWDARSKKRTRHFHKLYGHGKGLASIDLVAATTRRFHEGTPCPYGAASVGRTHEENVVRVVSRRSGEEVTERTFRGKLPPCPPTMPSTPVVDGGDVDDADLAAFLRSLVEG